MIMLTFAFNHPRILIFNDMAGMLFISREQFHEIQARK